MAYTPYYTGGWQSGEEGGTPITPAALNHMETGIEDANTLDATPTQGSTKAVKSGGVYTAIQQSTANMARSVSKSSIAAGTSCTIAFSPDDKCAAIISVVSLNSGKYATYIYEGYGPSSVRQAVTPLTPGNTYYTVRINDDRSVTITPGENIASQYWVGVLMVLGNPPTIT